MSGSDVPAARVGSEEPWTPALGYALFSGIFLLLQGASTRAARLIPEVDHAFPMLLRATQMVPVHSVLHEASHYVCMTPARRAGLDRDAGGDDLEESAVCYLQLLLADQLPGIGRARLLSDMDAWGYSFRLGSTRTWFEGDAADARQWLRDHGVIDDEDRPTGAVRPPR